MKRYVIAFQYEENSKLKFAQCFPKSDWYSAWLGILNNATVFEFEEEAQQMIGQLKRDGFDPKFKIVEVDWTPATYHLIEEQI